MDAALQDAVMESPADAPQDLTDLPDAIASPSRRNYVGILDGDGNASLSVPEIDPADMNLVLGYVYTTNYAEPGYVMLGNIVPTAGQFRFAAGLGNANAAYVLVVVDALRRISGSLDVNGDAILSVPEIDLATMPLVVGYVYTTNYAEPGYVALGNIIPGTGSFRFAAGASNGGAPFVLVVAASARSEIGTLDSNGDATLSVPEIQPADLPVALGYVFSSAYAEPGYVTLGNILRSDGVLRIAAGSANGSAAFILSVSE